MTGDDFISTYCRKINFNTIIRISLIEKTNFDCIFWSEGTCMVYKYRPLQCRMYPFWQQNLVNRAVWDSLAQDCPGINQGKKHTYREIQKILRRREFEPFLS